MTLSVHSVAQDLEERFLWYRTFFDPNPDSVEQRLTRAQKELAVAEDVVDSAAMVKPLLEIGLLHLSGSRNYEASYAALIRAFGISPRFKQSGDNVFILLTLAKIFEDVEEFDRARELYDLAGQNIRDLKGPDLIRRELNFLVLTHTGQVLARKGDRAGAREVYEILLKNANLSRDAEVRAEALFQYGRILMEDGEQVRADTTLRASLKLWRSANNRMKEASVLHYFGGYYLASNKPEKAYNNFKAALDIRTSLNDKTGMARCYNDIATFYLGQKNYQKAADNARVALTQARSAQSREDIRRSLELLSEVTEATNNFREALAYRKEYITFTEFLQRDKDEKAFVVQQFREEINQRNSEIDNLNVINRENELRIQMQERTAKQLYAIIGLSAIVGLLIFFLYLQNRRTNRKLREVNVRINQQNVQLQDLNATKDKFFSIISHDLKGPLNSLTSFSGLLINHTDSLSKEEIRMLAQDLDKSVKNLFALLENLLEWSRSQTGNIEFKPEPFSLTDMLAENQQLLKTQADAKKIAIELLPSAPIVVRAHRNSVNTVIRNLVSNAIKFTPEGGAIKMIAKATSEQVVVSIADSGVGMSPDVLGKLFRIDSKHTTRGTAQEKGTGLGLILCKDFIEKNGGRIWVESEVGQGSTFFFSLPLGAKP